MSQPVTYSNLNETTTTTSRRFTGFPLNSTLVSSYTPDTIRSIITQAAVGQPYSTAVWIRLSRVGIQVSAQDAQIARTRIPVFIPIGLTHDIFMLPSINNVICIVYDEVQSNMKGILLYVVYPSDAQLIREEFRVIKQTHNTQQQTPYDNRYSSPNEVYPSENVQLYSSISSKSPLFSNQTIRQPSPRRLVYVRDNETTLKRDITPTLPQITYIPSKGSYHSDHRRHRSPRRNRPGQSPTKRSSDSGIKQDRKNTSRSPDKRNRTKLPVSRSSPDLAREQIQLQEQQQQQQQLLLQQQQQMAVWQAGQQPQLIPMGIYNRYVPKTIPLPTGETLKTTLPPPGTVGAITNGAAMAFVEPMVPLPPPPPNRSRSRSRSRSISPPSQQQNRLPTGQPIHQHRHHHRRHHTTDHTTQSSRIRPKYNLPSNDMSDADNEMKQYLKMLVDEMQTMKLEMNKLRQASAGAPNKSRSDSLQIDLKEIRSNIDVIRSRMAMTPRIAQK